MPLMSAISSPITKDTKSKSIASALARFSWSPVEAHRHNITINASNDASNSKGGDATSDGVAASPCARACSDFEERRTSRLSRPMLSNICITADSSDRRHHLCNDHFPPV